MSRKPPHPRRIALLAAFILIANILDAAYTIRHVSRGATEINPLMRYALSIGPNFFLAAKMLLVSAGICGLAIMARKTRSAWTAMQCVAFIFGAIVCYHIWLLFYVIPPH